MNFSDNLQYLRKKQNLSQEQLAEELNVTRQSVSKWESGQSYPEMDKLITISKFFGCTLEQLVNGDVSEIKQKESTGIDGIFKRISSVIEDIAKMLSQKDFKGILRFIIEMAIIVLIIWILKLPFVILEEAIRYMLHNFGQVGSYVSKITYYLIEIAYIVASFIFFIYAFKTRFLNQNKSKEKEVKKETIPQEIKEEELEVKEAEEKSKKKKDYTLISIIAAIIIFCLKVFAFFILSFVIMAVICLAGCLTATIILLFQGVGIFGIVLGCFSSLMIVIIITEILISFIFGKKSSFKRLLITFCVSLVLTGAAIAISALDITKFEITNDFPKEFEWTTEKLEIAMNKNIRLGENMIYENVDYVIDNSLKERIVVEVIYHKDCRNDVIELNGNTITAKWDIKDININKIYNSYISGLKDNKLYNLSNLYEVNIVIYGNKNNIEQLQKYEAIDETEFNAIECENRLANIEEQNRIETEDLIKNSEQATEDLIIMTDKYNNLNTEYEKITTKYNELLEKIKNLNE